MIASLPCFCEFHCGGLRTPVLTLDVVGRDEETRPVEAVSAMNCDDLKIKKHQFVSSENIAHHLIIKGIEI
jgi:hypothetical protein